MKGWRGPADMLTSYRALEKMLGSEKLPLGAIISGLTGSGYEGGRQALTSNNHRINDPVAVGVAGLKSAVSGAGSSVGRRVAGTPGAAAGAFAGSKATGASNADAGWSAAGAVLGHLVMPDQKGDSMGAALGRQVGRSAFGKGLAKAGSDLFSPKPGAQRRRQP